MGKRIIDDSVKAEYLEWLVTIPIERDPKTKTAMADHLGVTKATLYNWEKSEEFQDALRKLKLQWGAKFEATIFGRLIDIVENGTDTSAIQAAKVLLPHMNSNTTEAKETDLTTEHLTAIRKALKDLGYQVVDNG